MKITTKPKPGLQEMEYEPIVTMKAMLAQHNYYWSRDLAELMFPRTEAEKLADPRNTANQRRVFNIAHGITKNSTARISFLNQGKILLDKYQQNYASARLVADQMKLAATA